jgi:hypothetical protein
MKIEDYLNEKPHIGLKFRTLEAALVLIMSMLLPVMVGIGHGKGIGGL